MVASVLGLLGLLKLDAQTVQPFFEPPVSSGTIEVKLYPTESVGTGTPTLVTFGIPFTRGSVTNAELANLRVLNSSGSEIPAYVKESTPWRHATDLSIHNQSVRIAMIQINHSFSVSYPNYETITVEYGLTPRTMSITASTDPKTAWHMVTSGDFVASDNVMEPDVYAVLPKEYLCNGALKTRMLPLDSSVPLTREDPYVVDAATYPGYVKKDHAQHNFFFSIINEDDPLVLPANECPYKTDFEPWLYDRVTTMYNLYMQSGNFKVLREAVRNAQFYKNQLYDDTTIPTDAIGVFKLKVTSPTDYIGNNGAMYSYNEGLAYTYWLTGDEEMLNPIEWVVNAHEANDPPTLWSASSASWTERFTSFRLLVNTIAFEVTGSSTYKTNFTSQYNDFIWHQNGAGGVLPASRIDGGLYHYGSQHGDGTPTELLASSWMTALVAGSMVRVYGVTDDINVAQFIKRLGTFESAALKEDAMHSYSSSYSGNLWYGDYMMKYDGTTDERDGSEIEHSMDIAVTLAWAAYFSYLLGTPESSFYTHANYAYDSYDIGVNYWVRPSAPSAGFTAYRVTPWRKYGWEYTPSASFTWLMQNLDPTLGVHSDNTSEYNKLYPNPSNQWIKLDLSSYHGAKKISFINTQGVIQKEVTTEAQFESINIENLSSGIYIICITDGDIQTSQRFIKN